MKFPTNSNANRQLPLNMDSINAYASRWKPFTHFMVEITRIDTRKATDPQRGYYFSIVLPALMNGCGYDPEEANMVHRQLKIIFFNVQPDKRGIYRDKDIPSVFGDSSDIGMQRRVKFIDWVIRKASEYGEYVAPPKGE